MKKTILLISIFLLFQIAIFGQDKDVCIEIKAVDKVSVGENLNVSANLKINFFTDPFLKFNWKLPKEITTEQPETVFSITKQDAGQTITIKLEVEGLPDNCLKVYEKNIEVEVEYKQPPSCGYKPPIPNDAPWVYEKQILTYESEDFFSKEDATFYIVIQTQNPKSKQLAQRKLKIIKLLTKEKKIAKDKIIIKVLKSKREETEYWIVPKGATPPN